MYNIVLFEKNITDLESKIMKLYLGCVQDKTVEKPVVFCDTISCIIPYNIPVFNTFYIKAHFHKKYILVSKYDSSTLIDLGIKNIIIAYNSKIEDRPKSFMSYDYNQDFTAYLESLYDKEKIQ